MQVFEITTLKRRALAQLAQAPRSSIELAVQLAVPLWAIDAALEALAGDGLALPCAAGWGLSCEGRAQLHGVPR